MSKSSRSSKEGVKRFSPEQREKLLELLLPMDLQKAIIEEGIGDYIGSGTRLLLELLLHAEAKELGGKWHAKEPGRLYERWGSEKGKALYDGAKREVERPKAPTQSRGEHQPNPGESTNTVDSAVQDDPCAAALVNAFNWLTTAE